MLCQSNVSNLLQSRSPVDEVSEVVQQFTVVLWHQVVPAECTVLHQSTVHRSVTDDDVSSCTANNLRYENS